MFLDFFGIIIIFKQRNIQNGIEESERFSIFFRLCLYAKRI